MRLLLLGGSGQLGRALAPRLGALGSLTVPGRAALDLEAPASVAPFLDALRPDVIVNAAAYTAVDRAEAEVSRAVSVNAQAPTALARWAERNAAALVHISTDYVYSGTGEKPWREDDAPDPQNAYGRSKLEGDTAVLVSGARAAVVRTSWLYAEPGRNFVTVIAEKAHVSEELHVVADQVGAPTSADRLADIVVTILHAGTDPRAAVRENPGLFHACAGGEVSRLDLARAIVEGLAARGVVLACRHIAPTITTARPGEAVRPLNSRLDLSRLKSRYGIDPPDWRLDLSPVLDRIARRLATRH